MRVLASLLAALVVGGCAPNHKNISAIYVSEIPYMNASCEQLREALLHTNTSLGNEAYRQDTARGTDAVGIIAIGLPVASMTGRDAAGQVAILKGQRDAIERAGKAKKCGSLAPTIVWD